MERYEFKRRVCEYLRHSTYAPKNPRKDHKYLYIDENGRYIYNEPKGNSSRPYSSPNYENSTPKTKTTLEKMSDAVSNIRKTTEDLSRKQNDVTGKFSKSVSDALRNANANVQNKMNSDVRNYEERQQEDVARREAQKVDARSRMQAKESYENSKTVAGRLNNLSKIASDAGEKMRDDLNQARGRNQDIEAQKEAERNKRLDIQARDYAQRKQERDIADKRNAATNRDLQNKARDSFGLSVQRDAERQQAKSDANKELLDKTIQGYKVSEEHKQNKRDADASKYNIAAERRSNEINMAKREEERNRQDITNQKIDNHVVAETQRILKSPEMEKVASKYKTAKDIDRYNTKVTEANMALQNILGDGDYKAVEFKEKSADIKKAEQDFEDLVKRECDRAVENYKKQYDSVSTMTLQNIRDAVEENLRNSIK